jgi:GntR family transcriptional repressor for pyruvate dehydrogenase complex
MGSVIRMKTEPGASAMPRSSTAAPATNFAPGAHLPDQVAGVVAAEIRAGRPAASEKLPTEAALAQRFAVSRTVIREAVSRLKSLGLVDSRQGSGLYVKEAGFSPLHFDASSVVSLQAVLQMVEVRRALETEVAGLAAQRRTAAGAQRIRAAFQALDEAVQAGGDGVDEDVTFHRAIAEAAGNPFLIGTLEYLGQFLQGATRVTRANEARRRDFERQVRDEHTGILRAIEAGDAAAARRAATRHMNHAASRIGQADPAFWQQAGVKLARPLVSGLSGQRQPSAAAGRRTRPVKR